MAVARIRTSDPEVIEFLSRHLADSGYRLEFVHPGEPIQGEADLEIDASRMDIASAMAAAQQESGIVTVLSGILKPAPQRDLFDEAVNTPSPREYAEISPYAQGAQLEDEPSTLHKAADSVANALAVGLNSVDAAAKGARSRFAAWKSQRDAERSARRERLEQERATEAERRREAARLRAEETARLRAEEDRRRAEEERLAAIRREEMARRESEERVRRQQEQLAAAESAMRETEEQRRMETELAQRRAEQRKLAEQVRAEERRRAEEQERAERERQEQLRLAEEARQHEVEVRQRADQERNRIEEEAERQRAAAASQAESVANAEGATIEDNVPEWQSASAPEPFAPRHVTSPAVPVPVPTIRKRLPRVHRTSGRDRVFRRAGVAAAIGAAGVVSVWSLAGTRRPANPLTQEQLVRSVTVQQQTPFGPATAPAPVPVAKPLPPQKRPVGKSPARTRATRTHSSKAQTAKRASASDSGDEVVVKHFNSSQKPEQAKVKMKNGVKIISESD